MLKSAAQTRTASAAGVAGDRVEGSGAPLEHAQTESDVDQGGVEDVGGEVCGAESGSCAAGGGSGVTPAAAAAKTASAAGKAGSDSNGGKGRKGKRRKAKFVDRVEAFISRLSTRNNFWHRVCSLIWLPYAFRSGIKMKRLSKDTFTAVLPFKRFNRNWYNAMAGAALLANSEIAGGMYIFGICGGDYTVVCKRLEYRFLRPCFGPAVYKIKPREAIEELVSGGGEFNVTVDIDICQQLTRPGEREKRVGKCEATFHITPKVHHKQRRERKSGGARPASGSMTSSTATATAASDAGASGDVESKG